MTYCPDEKEQGCVKVEVQGYYCGKIGHCANKCNKRLMNGKGNLAQDNDRDDKSITELGLLVL